MKLRIKRILMTACMAVIALMSSAQNEAMTNINARLDRLEEMITNAMATKSNNGGVGESTAATTADGDPKPKRR
jgi:outer membrane lipoprotein-sorting protein